MTGAVGKSYLIDHCVNHIRHVQEDRKYKAYITDCLRLISESTARFAGGKYMDARFVDGTDWYGKRQSESRTAEEIIESIKAKINKEA